MLIKCIIGAIFGTAVFFILLALFSLLCLKKDIAPETYKPVVFACGIVSGMLCGYISVKPIKKRGIVFGAVSALPMMSGISVFAVLFSKNGLTISGWIFALMIIISSAIGGIVAANKKH